MRTLTLACTLAAALAGAFAGPAAAAPGFFAGVVERPETLTARDNPAAFADLGLSSAVVWVDWLQGMRAPTDANVATVAGVVSALPAGSRVVVAVGSDAEHTPLDDAARDDYCTFVKTLLDRVPSVRDAIVWNEPNKRAGWSPLFDESGAPVGPAAYVALVAHCWDVLHAAFPQVNVVVPALAPSGNNNPDAPSNVSLAPKRYIEEMGAAYKASGRTKRIFDMVAHHPYGAGPRERPWILHGDERWAAQGDWARLMTAFRSGFSFGGSAQPVPGECKGGPCVWIWYTEAGFQTTPDEEKAGLYTGTETVNAIPADAGGESTYVPGTPGPDQRTQLEDSIRLAACQPYVQAYFNYRLVDDEPLAGWQSGFLWADETPKPSYAYAKSVIAEAKAGDVDCGALKGGPAPARDSVPPGVPSGLVATPGDGAVDLLWSESFDPDVQGYHVERSRSRFGPWTRITDAPVAGTSFHDAVKNAIRRYYVVRAVDTTENLSARSKATCATPTAAVARYAPSSLDVRSGRLASGGVRALRANDARRLTLVAGDGGRVDRAALQTAIRLPACARPPTALHLEVDASSLPAGARVALVVRNARTGRWTRVGRFTAGTSDRLVRATVPLGAAANRTVAVRAVAEAGFAFRARLDLVRVVVTS